MQQTIQSEIINLWCLFYARPGNNFLRKRYLLAFALLFEIWLLRTGAGSATNATLETIEYRIWRIEILLIFPSMLRCHFFLLNYPGQPNVHLSVTNFCRSMTSHIRDWRFFKAKNESLTFFMCLFTYTSQTLTPSQI